MIVHSDHCAKKLLPWFDGTDLKDRAPKAPKPQVTNNPFTGLGFRV